MAIPTFIAQVAGTAIPAGRLNQFKAGLEYLLGGSIAAAGVTAVGTDASGNFTLTTTVPPSAGGDAGVTWFLTWTDGFGNQQQVVLEAFQNNTLYLGTSGRSARTVSGATLSSGTNINWRRTSVPA